MFHCCLGQRAVRLGEEAVGGAIKYTDPSRLDVTLLVPDAAS